MKPKMVVLYERKVSSPKSENKVQAAYNKLHEDRTHMLYDDSDEETQFAMDWCYEMKQFDKQYFAQKKRQNHQVVVKSVTGIKR